MSRYLNRIRSLWVLTLNLLIITSCINRISSVTEEITLYTQTPNETALHTASINETLISPADQTATPELIFNQRILFTVGRLDYPNEIWMTSYPFQVAHPLFQNEEYSFGEPVWSSDGEWLAYSRTAIGCPSLESSIWISKQDGSEARQISPAVEGKVNPQTGNCEMTLAHPAFVEAWLEDGKHLILQMDGTYILSLETGDITPIQAEEAIMAEGVIFGDRFTLPALRGVSTSGRVLYACFFEDRSTILSWIDIKNPKTAKILSPPETFIFSFFDHFRRFNDHAWSPNSRFLLIPDRFEEKSRLWRIDLEKDVWEIVQVNQIRGEEDEVRFVNWSSDGQWVAWWSRAYDNSESNFDIKILVFEATTWSLNRTILISDVPNGLVLGWVTTNSNEAKLATWREEQGGGIFLLDTKDSNRDRLLISYDLLDAQMQGRISPGPIQP